jgi:hypothetical protein
MRLLIALFFVLASRYLSAGELIHIDGTCMDLSGRYAYWGNWEQFEVEGPPAQTAMYKAANLQPRFDRFALSIYTRQVIEPRMVVIQQKKATGILLVNILGKGIDLRGIDKLLKLPAEVVLKCVEGKWQKSSQFSGGGENVPSEGFRKILLRVGHSGDLIAEGEELTIKGWFRKTNLSQRWIAKFNRIAD